MTSYVDTLDVSPCRRSGRCVVDDCLQQCVVDLGLVEAAQEEHDGLADPLNVTLGTGD
jgi:hypothetical protein